MTQTQTQIFIVDDAPLKFFVQKDLPEEELAALEEAITDEGGIVVGKVPIRGYIVVNYGTPEAERLLAHWNQPDRPERFFVPCRWVEECRAQNRVLNQVFVREAQRVRIHIHKSVANVRIRGQLMEKIFLHGGDASASYEDATVILASKELDVFKGMRKEFQGSEDKFVESLKWVDNCIDQDYYTHTPNSVRNPGGRRTGDERMPFTEEDETNLCNWIASVIPFKESGGRTGNKIYLELVSRADQPGYQWVERHTWQSWRERYKKNSERLDQHIAAIVSVGQANGTIVPNRAQFGYFKLNEGGQVGRKRRRALASEEADADADADAEGEGHELHTNGESSGTGTAPDSQEDGEWAIREGNAPAPGWAKRTSSPDAASAENDRKRQKTASSTFRTFVLAPATQSYGGVSHPYSTATEFAADFGSQPPPLDHIQQEINAIAREQRFLPEEVHAYYNRNGDLLATRQRFERVRAYVDNLP